MTLYTFFSFLFIFQSLLKGKTKGWNFNLKSEGTTKHPDQIREAHPQKRSGRSAYNSWSLNWSFFE